MPVKEDFRNLNGPQKAAIMMLSLNEEQAAGIFTLMDDEEIKEISQHMASLGDIRADTVERLFSEFVEQISAGGSLIGTYESTERLLLKSIGKERVDNIMEEIRGPAGRTVWDKLGNVNEGVLATYLKNEYPQTVAVVLTKITPDHAARVLSLLPDGMSLEVIMRMLSMEAVQRDVLDDIESTLRTEFMSNLARASRRDAHELIADIFNNFDRNTENMFMVALEERSQEAAERIKALMFTFDDLAELDPGSIQTLLRRIDKAKLPVALKGTSDPVRNVFFSNMSERGAKLLRDDLADMGPVRLRDVDQAQGSIVAMAKELAAIGEIMITEGKEDELVY